MRFEQQERWTRLATAGIQREYPNKIAYCLTSDADLLPPRQQTPVFYGCFDWHSAVHAHWTLVRLMTAHPDAEYVKDAKQLFREQFTETALETERAWLAKHPSFERPYGLSWLLFLIAAMQSSPDQELQAHADRFSGLQTVAIQNLLRGFDALPFPIRTGSHQQSAFSLGLIWEAAGVLGDKLLQEHVAKLAKRFFAECRTEHLAAEPSGHDFLSPVLAEADLMSRVLSPSEFKSWWRPVDELARWCQPVEVVDPEDGHLVHFAGLNLSRAWMLQSIGEHTLTQSDLFRQLAAAHRQKGLSQIQDEAYAGSHWLGTFAVYMMHREALAAHEPLEPT